MRDESKNPRRAFSHLETDAQLLERLKNNKNVPSKWLDESIESYANRVGFPRRIVWDDGPDTKEN